MAKLLTKKTMKYKIFANLDLSEMTRNMCRLVIDISASLSTFAYNEYIEKRYSETAESFVS